MWSVVAQRAGELALAHLRAALDADLPGLLDQLVLRPVVVGAGLAALAADGGPRGVVGRVGDARGLLLARALSSQRLVLLLVLDGVVGHALLLPDAFSADVPRK